MFVVRLNATIDGDLGHFREEGEDVLQVVVGVEPWLTVHGIFTFDDERVHKSREVW